MNNRDNNENIYRHLEKCYALLQVHILFSFHTLIYILFTKTDANIRNFIEISWNFHGKCVENHSFSFLFIPQPLAGWPIFSVVFGRFCGHSRRKSENFRENQRISEKIIPFLSISLHFLSISLHFLSPTPRFYALQHIFETILSEE